VPLISDAGIYHSLGKGKAERIRRVDKEDKEVKKEREEKERRKINKEM
jgi:hypothetical protein